MASYNDTFPVGYQQKVFRVNLETVNRSGHLVPNRTEVKESEAVSEADQMKNTRSTFLPDAGLHNMVLKHGDTFAASGMRAYNLKKQYATGLPDSLLVIVSES